MPRTREIVPDEKARGLGVGFIRTVRVSGYLTEDSKMSCDSKQAEYADRVKHI